MKEVTRHLFLYHFSNICCFFLNIQALADQYALLDSSILAISCMKKVKSVLLCPIRLTICLSVSFHLQLPPLFELINFVSIFRYSRHNYLTFYVSIYR